MGSHEMTMLPDRALCYLPFTVHRLLFTGEEQLQAYFAREILQSGLRVPILIRDRQLRKQFAEP